MDKYTLIGADSSLLVRLTISSTTLVEIGYPKK